ncbi:transposase [Telmatocola sphagniphila]|uniref:Transposase n=1 Tax=Telmatocola sphagniphila TaxID=1123043 RepID=A0A8E6EVD5_9BACT|nr:transposase [Telmatocola sphagniphila]QVL34819.1 transposase [Telmatocola sphagniphila]
MCAELWKYRPRLWTFVEVKGVELTNNAAERVLRPFVIWRKICFGTQSAAGRRFLERMVTVIETCRQQKRNCLAFIKEAIPAHFNNKTPAHSWPGRESVRAQVTNRILGRFSTVEVWINPERTTT